MERSDHEFGHVGSAFYYPGSNLIRHHSTRRFSGSISWSCGDQVSQGVYSSDGYRWGKELLSLCDFMFLLYVSFG